VRLLLASSRPEAGSELVAADSRVAVVLNAQDRAGRRARRRALAEETDHLAGAGLAPAELDLRRYYRRRGSVSDALDDLDLLWVAGGNVFVLREAMRRSGFDAALSGRERPLTYVGWSAGACVCGPTLRGLELVDPLPRGLKPTWEGLGLVDFALVPHYHSGPPLGAEIDRVVAFWNAQGTPHRALRDGEMIAVTAGQPSSPEPGSRGGALR
jgi:dipeptidase E